MLRVAQSTRRGTADATSVKRTRIHQSPFGESVAGLSGVGVGLVEAENPVFCCGVSLRCMEQGGSDEVEVISL